MRCSRVLTRSKKMIKMQYPNINNNSLCDGEIHDIVPYCIYGIENLEIFLLKYYDETKKTKMFNYIK